MSPKKAKSIRVKDELTEGEEDHVHSDDVCSDDELDFSAKAKIKGGL